ncbi:transposase [Catellatospora citrea]|uniref:Transposase IS116/IS110/IS902 C-terminal domain-containing protein n=1 Tax=Catellatospora citrea TaxID=53366 RepID=A0A8J3NY21_9ACTN|nr:hypothetical protein Cci01nite_16620 [Catellatospora citrea]
MHQRRPPGQSPQRLFRRHPYYLIITSFPCLAGVTGGRVLAEIADDRSRFVSSRALKAFAGSVPVTRASGRNGRFAGDQEQAARRGRHMWAAIAVFTHAPANVHYRRRRAGGDSHNAAARKLLGQVYHCLETHQAYRPDLAFAHQHASAGDRPNQELT